MKHLARVFLLVYTGVVYAAPDQNCKGEKFNPALMNAGGLRSYISRFTNVKSIEDVICCLPEAYRENYIVSHSSNAGQNGVPSSPRVIMFDPKDMNNFLSINGGVGNVNQGMSIEYMHHDENRHAVEYYDIDFSSGRGKMSEKNPALCMSCHGDMDGKAGPAGARPLIESLDNEWPTFLSGSFRAEQSRDLMPCAARVEAGLRTKVEKIATDALKSNPRYKCLGPTPSTPRTFDAIMEGFSQDYFARAIPHTPDYERYKYLFLGHFAKCDQDKLNSLDNWMPKQELERLNDMSLIAPEIKTAENPREACVRMANKALKRQSEIEKRQVDQLNSNNSGSMNSPMAIDDTPFLCLADRSVEALCKKSGTGDFSVEDRYKMDTFFQPNRRNSPIVGGPSLAGKRREFDNRMRFLLESRGIGASQFSMSPSITGYQRGATFEVSDEELVHIKKDGWRISYLEILNKRRDAQAREKSFVKGARNFIKTDKPLAKNEKEAVCRDLAALSMKAFSGGKAIQTTTEGNSPTTN